MVSTGVLTAEIAIRSIGQLRIKAVPFKKKRQKYKLSSCLIAARRPGIAHSPGHRRRLCEDLFRLSFAVKEDK